MSQLPESVIKFLQDNPDLELFEAIITDINGHARGKLLPRSKLSHTFDGTLKLPLTTLGFDIWGRDVQSWVLEDGDSDGICFADPDTITRVPWLDLPTGQILMAMQNVDGSPCAYCSRTVLGRLQDRLESQGMIPVMASEMEFHLIQQDNDEHGYPLHTQFSKTQRPTVGGNTYSIDVMRDKSDMMFGILNAAEAQGLPIDTLIKEAARSQYEINLNHEPDALLSADQAFLLKRTIRGLARQSEMRATFMAKPFGDIEGNGMHVHCSLIDGEGKNLFDSGNSEGSQLLKHAIAGCLATLSDSMLLFAPHWNSYRRFKRGSHAPVTPSWGYDNRTTAIRVPASSPKATRIEHRMSGADANPYLVNAAILAGMLYGIENKLEAPEPTKGDASLIKVSHKEALPRYWQDALRRFMDSEFIDEYFGPEFKRVFSEAKLQEMDEFDQQVTLQEYDAYL